MGRSRLIYGALRCKNEGRWIGRVIDSMRPVCEQILLMDDDSTDDTRVIAEDHGAVVLPTPFSHRGFIHEALDKEWLLAQIWEIGAKSGDWVLAIDGDEELAPGDAVKLIGLANFEAMAWSFRVKYLWNSPDQVRVDGVYSNFRRPSFFRLKPGQIFQRTKFGGSFHCKSVPTDCSGHCLYADVSLLHYGYLHKEDRIRKFEFYNRIDPNNSIENSYKHMVIGDLFPADSKFVHGGPLQLSAL